MQTIEFLRNFFTKGLEIHSSFYHIFLDFFQIFKIKIFNFEIFYNFGFPKMSNLKITEFQI
jgi:hypothetical protein